MNESLTSIYTEESETNGLLFTTSILELCSVGVDGTGTYSCQATNAAGNDSIEFEVQVRQGKLGITSKYTQFSVILFVFQVKQVLSLPLTTTPLMR